MSRSVLVVDDDAGIVDLLRRFFERAGWAVFTAHDASTATAVYDRERPDLVILDLALPGVSGLDLLEQLRRADPDTTVIMLTGEADIPTAVEAMRRGAENFLTKPVELKHLDAAAERAVEKVELRRRSRFFASLHAEPARLETLGSSLAMREVSRQIELLAGSDATVLLVGETGTGKGWVAHLIHSLSPRATAPFVEIGCAGLSASFLHSEIFGHEKGALTDDGQPKRGLFELAHTGTIFLDEIGDLVPELQPKLLNVLESRRFRRLGGSREIEVDVRLVAATNRDLQGHLSAGRFREDLFYRLAVLPIRLPPLRDRGRADIAELARRLLAELRRHIGRGPTHISEPALDLLARYPWPGNIRELRNVLERVLLLADDVDELMPAHLPSEIARVAALPDADDLKLPLHEVERRYIARVLTGHRGNRVRTARTLGISRAALYDKLRRFGLADVGRVRKAARTSSVEPSS